MPELISRLFAALANAFVLGGDGRVRFFRDGAMTPAEIGHALQLVRDGAQDVLVQR